MSKVKAHLAKKKHHDIGVCTALHTREDAAYYQQHYSAMVEASNKRKSVSSAVGEASFTRREDGAASLLLSKSSKKARNCTPTTSTTGTTTPNSTSTIETVDLTTNTLAPFKHVRGTMQTFLTASSTSKEAVANMDYAMGAYVIEGGLAFRTIEDRNLLEIIKLARTVPFSYKPPTRKRLTDDILPLLHKQRQDGAVYEYYRANPDSKVRVVAPTEALDENGDWNNWIPDPVPKSRKNTKSTKK